MHTVSWTQRLLQCCEQFFVMLTRCLLRSVECGHLGSSRCFERTPGSRVQELRQELPLSKAFPVLSAHLLSLSVSLFWPTLQRRHPTSIKDQKG